MERLKTIWKDFKEQEDGAVLTEYIILLGLVAAGVIGAVLAFGGSLADAWENWNTWIGSAELNPNTNGGGGGNGED